MAKNSKKEPTAGERLAAWRRDKFGDGKRSDTAQQTAAAGFLGYGLSGYRRLENDQGRPPFARADEIETSTEIEGLAALWYPELSS